MTLRAAAVKAEIADIEAIKFKMEGKEEQIIDLRRQLKMKVQTDVRGCLCKWNSHNSAVVFISWDRWLILTLSIQNKFSVKCNL